MFLIWSKSLKQNKADDQLLISSTVIGDVTNIILDPIFIFVFRLGVTGAATAHVISQ